MADVTTDAYELIYNVLIKRDGWRVAYEGEKDAFWVIRDIWEMWDFMSIDDRKVIFGNDITKLVERYIETVSFGWGGYLKTIEEAAYWVTLAVRLKRSNHVNGVTRPNVGYVISGWRKMADGTIEV